MFPQRKRDRAEIVRENASPKVMEVVRRFYPEPLRSKVLLCCQRQLSGLYRRNCAHSLCPVCLPNKNWHRYMAHYRQFQACSLSSKSPRIAHEVYTLPKFLRPDIFHHENYAKWRRAVLSTIRDIHGADVGGVMNLHTIGKDPSDFHPHWDVVINGHLVEDGKARVHRPPRIDFDDARAIHHRHLCAEFGLTSWQDPRNARNANVWLDRKTKTIIANPGQVRHRIRYSSREPYRPERASYSEAWKDDLTFIYHPDDHDPIPLRRRPADVMENLDFIRGRLGRQHQHIWFGFMAPKRIKNAVAAFDAQRRKVAAVVDDLNTR